MVLKNAHGAGSDIHRDIAKMRVIVSEAHRDAAITQTMVSEIHRDMLNRQNRTDDQSTPVSDICILLNYRMNKRSLLLRFKSGQWPPPPVNSASHFCI
jgi:hypothetical protein